ncbi:hypothetical protein [Erythrobacter sp.]|uniref:hypothetical protein n=1 Tax=Erythrobacter sp. TaxID=1042 RepID=UPI001B26B767|nr:hypothetical protein [Erythrobacter sp.]MBO6528155.1 hypothetical protein [Erythrobacter sp.]MBO6530713.1 hypothetical protein [Erythrobacter sp.]
MSILSTASIKLGGFLCAHALWILSDLPHGDMYVPQALCSKNGDIELVVFEADTQAEAVANGKQFLHSEASNFDHCAFARDGQVMTAAGYVDVLIVELVEGASDSIVVLQPYSAREGFQLLGNEVVATETSDLDEATFRASFREGAKDHTNALAVWGPLNSNRTIVSPLAKAE